MKCLKTKLIFESKDKIIFRILFEIQKSKFYLNYNK